MKKLALFFASILLLAACGNRIDNTIKYDGPQIVDIVLLEELNLNATSDEPLTYYSDNDLYVTVTDDGVIKGKNVGEANITISNSVNTITIKVLVSLFEEPTFDFGISQDDIKKISKYFDIQEISVVYGGKFSYIQDRPRKYVRVKPGVRIDVNEFLKSEGFKFKITKPKD